MENQKFINGRIHLDYERKSEKQVALGHQRYEEKQVALGHQSHEEQRNFSKNQKISGRQLQALLLMDWIGKCGLLLPDFFQGVSAGMMLTGITVGTALGWLFIKLAVSAMDDQLDFFSWRRTTRIHHSSPACRIPSGLRVSFTDSFPWLQPGIPCYLLYGIYFLYHSVMMLYLCGQVSSTYLLPGQNTWILIAIPALIGCYLAGRGLEVRGRVCELMAFLMWGIFFLLLLLTVPEIRADRLWTGERIRLFQETDLLQTLKIGYYVMAGFGEIGILPIIFPGMLAGDSKEEKKAVISRASAKALLLSGLLLFVTFLECFGMFGQDGTSRLKWPVITLMSSVHLPAVFLQRWDILLISLILAAMFLSAGSGIYYLGLLGRQAGMKEKPALAGVTVLVYLLAAGAGLLEEKALFYQYGLVSYLICIPGIILFMVLRLMRRKAAEK